MAFVTDSKAIQYLQTFADRERFNFPTLYPAAGEHALNLLNKTLVFNPYFRITIDECLEHPYFAKIRRKEKETVSEAPVILDFEKEGELEEDRLRELFIEEINYYKKLKEEQQS